jgi:hypothetical protein
MSDGNLLLDPSELANRGWTGCDHLDCLGGCDRSRFHCGRLAEFLLAAPDPGVMANDHPDWPWNVPW